MVLPGATYDAYALRGESENRNKEFKCDLAMDRLSDHRFLANLFRLYLHAAALNLQIRLRQQVALQALPVAPAAATTGATADAPLPAAALDGAERVRYFRQRRQRDPLGEGHPCTWRLLFIKVAAEVLVSSRRIVVRLSASWPHLPAFQQVCARLRGQPLPTLEAG